MERRLYKGTAQAEAVSGLGTVSEKPGTWLYHEDTESRGRNFNTGAGWSLIWHGFEWPIGFGESRNGGMGGIDHCSDKMLWGPDLRWCRWARKMEADFRGINDSISTFWKGHSHSRPEVSVSQLLLLSSPRPCATSVPAQLFGSVTISFPIFLP